jgi:hypothetical protein
MPGCNSEIFCILRISLGLNFPDFGQYNRFSGVFTKIRKIQLIHNKLVGFILPFYEQPESKYLVLNSAIEREAGRFLRGQSSKIPDIYSIDKNGLLKLLWEKQKETK